ncbi:MAG: HAMP domain-containing protein [Gammaproteobacteria bacterium]|jgi:nitrogen fixation/metabolism regulation signal transduction histidine kinase|nr:HAMP domain-containing protein [Gammaproteobacteria bacterium]
MNSTFRNAASIIALVLMLMVSLYTISDATSHSATFGKYYDWLLFGNAIGLVVLLLLIVVNVYKLIVQYRLKAIGSRLTTRMISIFVLLTIIPVSVVYYFSLSFLHRGIDSWFDVGIETALEDSVKLGRGAVDLRKRDALRKTRRIANEIAEVDSEIMIVYIDSVREQYGANEVTLYDHLNSIIASSSIDSTELPQGLPLIDIGDLDADRPYLNLVDDPVYGLAIQIVMPVQSLDATEPARTLQAHFPFTDRINELTKGVQEAHDRYKQLALLRDPLKTSFTMALSIIWLLSVLSAIWLAFVAARKLVAPINELVEGTKAVAAGDYERQLTLSGNDELGFLLRSFNTMTRKIARSRAIAVQSQRMEALQKNYLESVLEQLTSGVLTIDASGLIKSSNAAACSIFDIENSAFTELNIVDVVREYPMMAPFFDAVQSHLSQAGEWQEELVLFVQGGKKILRVRGTTLLSEVDEQQEQVIVVDDLTELIQAQKDSAWSEMARRLAHEIKNPLTPIQLSAEHLQRKLSGEVSADKQAMLDRYTHTIVQQVEAMKSMVNAFTDYARSPQPLSQQVNFNAMLEEIAVLYHQDNTDVAINLQLDKSLPEIDVDNVRLRQLVHNLIKNSLETIEGKGWIRLRTACIKKSGRQWVEFTVEDSGKGIAEEVAQNLFEPYVTTKTSGSGLGLAIVQKIADEHGGSVRVGRAQEGGAKFSVLLPLSGAANEGQENHRVEPLKSRGMQ